MKKYKTILDIVLLGGIGLITLVAVMPKTIIMPSPVEMGLLIAVLCSLAAFLILIWRESPADEREAHNQSLASRYAYLVGSVVLIFGLVVQSTKHDIDPFIPIALLAMIATKIIVQRTRDS